MNMKPTLRLYIGPAAWLLAIVLSFLGGFLMYDFYWSSEEKTLGQFFQYMAYIMWMIFLINLDSYPWRRYGPYEYIRFDKGGSVTLWLRLKRDSNQDD